ncbi:RHS repeat-associated core domain-containing protein [Parafilimonas terrae]|uniref:RHS repeat-associated core domain-containing protein n=1 Tax=Parafilimonas terrae TaxID=1465490 RepID=A0A1I5XH91_9BACT|nr:RHS repeat-associated core domain-containing protein [Parafilimonas terrae]SFQ31343.1 RHS repeat-associated core domain-containing protein [Parafilimonas terrae]
MRTYTATSSLSYRYGFNGKEKDPNITSEDYDYGARIYDARTVRFLSIDPITQKYPWYTPYQFAGNSPIKNIDLDGLEPAGNQSDWEVVPGSVNVYAASHVTEKGKTVLTRAEQQLVKDKTGAKYWVTHHQWVETVDGISSTANDYSWYNEDPKIKLPAKDVGRWQRFETDIIKEQKGNWQMADNIGKVTFGAALVGTALPVAAYTGGSLWAINNPFTRVGLTKALVGGTVDLLAQKTVNTDGPVNWYNVGASAAFGNPWTASFAGSLSFRDNTGYHLSGGTDIVTGTVLSGVTGSIGGKLSIPYSAASLRPGGNSTVRAGLNLLPGYWSSVAGYLSSGAASNAIYPSTSSNQNSNASQTNNQEPPR